MYGDGDTDEFGFVIAPAVAAALIATGGTLSFPLISVLADRMRPKRRRRRYAHPAPPVIMPVQPAQPTSNEAIAMDYYGEDYGCADMVGAEDEFGRWRWVGGGQPGGPPPGRGPGRRPGRGPAGVYAPRWPLTMFLNNFMRAHGEAGRRGICQFVKCPRTGRILGLDEFGSVVDDVTDQVGEDFGADDDDGMGDEFGARGLLRRLTFGGRAPAPLGYAIQPAGLPGANGSGRNTVLGMYASGSTNPRNTFAIGGTGVSASVTLTSETTAWAVYRVIGFKTKSYSSDTNLSYAMVEDFKVGGSPNLFLGENAQDARLYEADDDHLIGLREQADVRAPNTATVSAFGAGSNGATVGLSAHLVVEVIHDDVYGKRALSRFARS